MLYTSSAFLPIQIIDYIVTDSMSHGEYVLSRVTVRRWGAVNLLVQVPAKVRLVVARPVHSRAGFKCVISSDILAMILD